MWKIYKHLTPETVPFVDETGKETKLKTKDDLVEAFYTVEDRDARTPKAVFEDDNDTHFKRFWSLKDAMAKCAHLNSGVM